MNYALTVYPLSNGFRGRLERELAAEPVYLNLGELRQLPVGRAISRLRSLQGARLVLPLEDENSRSILPVLTAVAAVSNASVIEVRYPDLHAERISRWSLAKGLVSLAGASAAAARNAASCRGEASRLLDAPRIEPRLPNDKKSRGLRRIASLKSAIAPCRSPELRRALPRSWNAKANSGSSRIAAS